MVVVRLRIAHVDLADPAVEQFAAGFDERHKPTVIRRRDLHSARLPSDIGGKRQKFAALRGERRRLLVLAAAQVDALFEIDRTIARHAECGITRRNAFHADGSVLVTIGTSATGRTGFLIPQRFAILHPERRRIDGVVVLHRLAVVTEIEITGPTLVERDIAAMDRPRYRESDCA